jgi:ribosomal 50S subunit-associated protein YjgA (DUF615 family)
MFSIPKVLNEYHKKFPTSEPCHLRSLIRSSTQDRNQAYQNASTIMPIKIQIFVSIHILLPDFQFF